MNEATPITEPAEIQRLLAEYSPAGTVPDRVTPRVIRSAKPCKCGGTCSTCESTARWNRIYEEKFADPTYYDRGLRLSSRDRFTNL